MAEIQVTRYSTATNRLRAGYPDMVERITDEEVSMTWGLVPELQLAFTLQEFPAAYRYNLITRGTLAVTASKNSHWSARYFYSFGLISCDPTTLTWNNRQLTEEAGRSNNTVDKTSGAVKIFGPSSSASQAAVLAKLPGIVLKSGGGFYNGDLAYLYTHIHRGEGIYTDLERPRLVITVNDAVTITSQIEQLNSPTGGYVDRKQAQTFSWHFVPTGPCAGEFSQASATFYWKLSTDASYRSVAATGSSVTIAANTFPAGTIQWYVEGRDNRGTTTSTPVYSFTTADTTTYATPVSPINEIVDGSAPITFTWVTSNAYGKKPYSSQLQYSTDATSWTDLAVVRSSDLSYTAPENILPSGAVYWRVRAYNQDAIAGPWSAPASLRNVAAPPAPSVITDAAPFTTISWAATDQQAYRIRVDGEDIGTFFDTARSHTLNDCLPDGLHTVSVAVQNAYSMWSADGETSFRVTNSPGAAITLSGMFSLDTSLSWNGGSGATVLIYRDGRRIGQTDSTDFADRLVLGSHEYFVLERLANGNYTRSNTVSGELTAEESVIADASGGEWIPLRLSEYSNGEQSFSFSRAFALRHVAGSKYPILELSPFYDRSGSYNTAFADPVAARRFEELLGRVVILKSRRGNVVIGVLAQIDKREADFYTAYTFSIQHIEWEDYVDAAGD